MAKILLIEDEQALLDMYRLRFEKEGIEILLADQGEAGLSLAKKEKPDLILLDLVMPGMDGYEVLKKLKANSQTKNLRVTIFSNLGQDEEIRRGLRLGAEDYLVKSDLTPTSLVKWVKKKLDKQSPAIKRGEKTRLTSREEKPTCSGFKILLIENEPAIIDMYKLKLEKEGCLVEVAENGAWGLKLAKKKKFDIILMDMVMPAMDGLAAIKSLKADPQTASVPIVVFSNSAQEKEMKMAIKAGAEAYYIKSAITPATLIHKVKEFCKK